MLLGLTYRQPGTRTPRNSGTYAEGLWNSFTMGLNPGAKAVFSIRYTDRRSDELQPLHVSKVGRGSGEGRKASPEREVATASELDRER